MKNQKSKWKFTTAKAEVFWPGPQTIPDLTHFWQNETNTPKCLNFIQFNLCEQEVPTQ